MFLRILHLYFVNVLMMKHRILVYLMAVMSFCLCGCSDYLLPGSDDDYIADRTKLCQAWQLIGYGTSDSFHMIDEDYRTPSAKYGSRFFIVFHPEGSFDGLESINQIGGKFTCKGHRITIEDLNSTLIYDENGWKESEEFLNRLMAAESYGIKDGSKLRLYYGDNEFLYFELLKAL